MSAGNRPYLMQHGDAPAGARRRARVEPALRVRSRRLGWRSRSPSGTDGLRRAARGPAREGLTLVEVILSIGLMMVLLTMIFSFYRNSIEERSETLAASQKLTLARTLMDQIEREIRQASGFAPEFGIGISGGKRFISIVTTRLPRKVLSIDPTTLEEQTAYIPPEFDLMEVKYYIASHEDIKDENGDPLALGLVRKETHTLRRVRGNGNPVDDGLLENQLADGSLRSEEDANPLEESLNTEIEDEQADIDLQLGSIKEELYAQEIKYLRFHYFDGNRWWPDWLVHGNNPLPQMIRITIGFTQEPPLDQLDEDFDPFIDDPDQLEPLDPDQYTTFVRIMQADALFGSRLSRTATDLMDEMNEAEGF